MKKSLVVIMTTGLVLTAANTALARTEANAVEPNPEKGNIVANTYDTTGTLVSNPADPTLYSTHLQGTWNSPYTLGIDGFSYNDVQDYTDGATQTAMEETYTVQYPIYDSTFTVTGMGTMVLPKMTFTSGPHGGYLTSTHRCRECHAVHRSAGKFKLLRSDSRFEACDWCHGTGAGSGFNIQMDNNDAFTEEYNVGHTMGYGIDSGKWRAPDDTYPAYAPNYYMGGFSCFDCHSPHANPARIMGYDQNGLPIASIIDTETGQVFNLGNPGHDGYTKAGAGGSGFAGADSAKLGRNAYFVPALGMPLPKAKPYYLAGSWLLIKNPDREMATADTTVTSPIKTYDPMGATAPLGTIDVGGGFRRDADITITAGEEIPDAVTTGLLEFDTNTPYPVNKVPTDWNNPIGSASLWDEDFSMFTPSMPPADDGYGYDTRNPFCRSLILDEFCTDCHDGNAGLHNLGAPMFSEDRALRNSNAQALSHDRWKGNYDIAYGHDSNVRH